MIYPVALCFAKTPGLTPAKTRLARDIGEEKCHDLYVLMVLRCKELMQQLSDFNPHVAINEPAAAQSPYWEDHLSYPQQGATLGEKLANAESFFFERFQHILFWGTDSPALTTQHFFLMQMALNHATAAFVPARDGGFAMYAARSRLRSGAWQNVTYSASSTLEELKSHIPGTVFEAPTISDLDTIEDIPHVLLEMSHCPSQGPAWDALRAFLQKI